MKKNVIGMAAATAILFGMSACGSKTSTTEAEQTAEDREAVANDPAQTPVVEEVEEIAVDPATGEETSAAEDSYTTTASGLKYKVIKKGTGKTPKATDVVLVNYEGKLTDGTKFDSSYDRGEPISFPLNRVIAGWTEGVQLMPEGSVYEFYIPSDLAYGPQGAPPVIPPNADLVFKVELIKVQ